MLDLSSCPISRIQKTLNAVQIFKFKYDLCFSSLPLTDDSKFNKNALNFPSNPLLFNQSLSQAFNLQEILHHQFLQSRQKQALQYPALQQNGNLPLLANGHEQDLHNSQAYLMNSFLAGQDAKQAKSNYTNHTNEDEEEANGISRTNSPASSSHSSEFYCGTIKHSLSEISMPVPSIN